MSSFIGRIASFSCLSSFSPLVRLYEIFNPPVATSNLSRFFRAADQVFRQEGSLGERYCVSLMDNGALVSRSLENSLNRSKIGRVKGFVGGLFRDASLLQKRQNLRTWELFKKSVIEKAGKQQFDWICNRYKKELPLHLLEAGDPFLVRYIKIFYVGLSQFNAEWIEK